VFLTEIERPADVALVPSPSVPGPLISAVIDSTTAAPAAFFETYEIHAIAVFGVPGTFETTTEESAERLLAVAPRFPPTPCKYA